MSWQAARVVSAHLALLVLVVAPSLQAQQAASLSGQVREASGRAVGNAKVDAKSGPTEESSHTDSSGKFSFASLTPGEYDVTVSAIQWPPKTKHIALSAGSAATLDFIMGASSLEGQSSTAPEAPQPQSGQATSPSLSDLGFSTQQTQGDAKLQALLQRRTEMLRVHQKLGLITAIPMAAALITGPMAKAKGRNGQTVREPTQANLDFHAALGGTTTALYFTTAYFAIWAPRVPGAHKHGAIRLHEALAFIHGPGMIATPILGYMAYKQEDSGERVHGVASAHGAVAVATTIAYGASILAVSWPIHLKFWEKR